MSTLREQIAERMRQAYEKKIQDKTETIAKHLGTDRKPSRGWWQIFKNECFEIEYMHECERHSEDWASTATTIKHAGKLVYEETGEKGLTCFIPGAWEQDFEALYAQANRKIEEDAKAAEAKRMQTTAINEEAERKRWGL